MPHRILHPALSVLLVGCASPSREAGDPAPVCRLVPLHAGRCQLGADHVLGGEHTAEERVPFVIYAFLVEGPNGERALIDLGPKSLEYTNAMFRRFGFFRDRTPELGPGASAEERFPDDVRQPHGNSFAQLREMDIDLSEIDHVVFTHLHADHHGMHDATDGGAAEDLPNATLHVSRIGWNDNLSKRDGERWGSYVDFAFGDFLLRRESEGRVRFEDDAEIFPGLRTMYLGGHSICSQAVIVETNAGPVIIASDDIYLYRLLEENIVPEIRTTPAAHAAAMRQVVEFARREGGIIVPLHDPVVWELYQKDPSRWLEALRTESDRAIAGYLARTGTPEATR